MAVTAKEKKPGRKAKESGAPQVSINIRDFALPRYSEIPDVGLFLEQTSKYTTGCLSSAAGIGLTPSMISNYVKQKLLTHPVKKQYSREQIATLLIIALCKTVLSLDEIRDLLTLSGGRKEEGAFYTRFSEGLKDAIALVHDINGEKPAPAAMPGKEDLLSTLLITIAYRLKLGRMLASQF